MIVGGYVFPNIESIPKKIVLNSGYSTIKLDGHLRSLILFVRSEIDLRSQ